VWTIDIYGVDTYLTGTINKRVYVNLRNPRVTKTYFCKRLKSAFAKKTAQSALHIGVVQIAGQ